MVDSGIPKDQLSKVPIHIRRALRIPLEQISFLAPKDNAEGRIAVEMVLLDHFKDIPFIKKHLDEGKLLADCAVVGYTVQIVFQAFKEEFRCWK